MVSRIVTALIGALFAGIGVYLAVQVAADDWRAWVLAGALVLLGGEALLAAAQGRDSWLARIGPLP